MKSFDEKVAYQGYAERQGFQPDQVYDVTPLLRQNTEAGLRNFNSLRESRLQEIEASKLTNLAQFSETLMQTLTTAAKEKGQRDMEEGLQQAYLDGISDEAAQAYDKAEGDVHAIESTFKSAAAEAEQKGAPIDVVRQFRDFGGWKGYGYAVGMAQQGAAFYPRFFQQASQQVSVNINGQEITLDTAKSGPERAAVEAEIRGQFLSHFSGMNPALLNKYLFPAMKQFENEAAIDWAEKQQKALQEERRTESQDILYNGIKAGMGGQTLIDFINRYAGDFGGVGGARKAGIEILENLINSRQIGEAEVNAILDYEFQAKDGSTRKIGEYWGRDFTKVKDLLYNASRVDLQRQLEQQSDTQNEFKLDFDRQTAERRAQGKDWSEAELRAIASNYEQQGLGPAPDWLKNYMSREDRADELDKERLMSLRQSRGYLTEEDLKNVSPTLYSQMIGYVKEDKKLTEVPQAFAKEAKDKIGAFTAKFLNETEGSKDKSPEYYNAFYNAQNAYDRYFRENIRTGMNQQEAHNKAMERIEKNFAAGTYTKRPTATANQEARINYAKASAAWSKDPNLINTQVLPGTERAIQALEQYAATGRGQIPYIYYQLAQGQRNLTAWDIANAQLEAAGKGSLIRPQAVQYVDQQDPQLRALLNWRPTTARTNRAGILSSSYKEFLDLVASKESASYGHYDAMNTGGAAAGTIAYGSANSKDVFGRGLSQMTIGEVMRLQDSNQVHAAGRYQIIRDTLKDLMKNGAAGLTPNDPFNAANQDALAVALARRRLNQGNAMVGLRNEWVGLDKVPDQVLLRAIDKLRATSPFNNPVNLLPGLVYRIGSRGYGSTGPHLDVKPVTPGTLQSNSSLPPISQTELDQYVSVGSDRQPLSKGTVTTDNDTAHRGRGSFGHDFAAPDGTPVFLKNGARVVGTFKGDQGTDHTIIELPDGRRYQFLHGVNA